MEMSSEGEGPVGKREREQSCEQTWRDGDRSRPCWLSPALVMHKACVCHITVKKGLLHLQARKQEAPQRAASVLASGASGAHRTRSSPRAKEPGGDGAGSAANSSVKASHPEQRFHAGV